MDNDNIVAVFNEIYDKYYKKIFAYFRKDFGKDDAEDLTQQAFMQLWAWLPNRYIIENKKIARKILTAGRISAILCVKHFRLAVDL